MKTATSKDQSLKDQKKKERPVKKLPVKKFTMAQAKEEIKKNAESLQKQKDARMKQCSTMIQQALNMTRCTLRVNPDSPLKNLQIIVVPNPEERKIDGKKTGDTK